MVVFMVADYIEDEVDKHQSFAIFHARSQKQAVKLVERNLKRSGCVVLCITVYPSAKSFDDAERMAERGPRPGDDYMQYVYQIPSLTPEDIQRVRQGRQA